MHPILHSLYQQLEQQRHEFSSWVSNAPAGQQSKVPAEGKWSAAQVLYHLAQVEAQVVGSIEKRLASTKPLKEFGLGTRLRSGLLNMVLKLPLKFKAPAVVREVPHQVLVPAVVQTWQETRVQLHHILESFNPANLSKEVFFHPRSGMLTLPQTLRFMIEHTEHHRRQMARLLS